MPVHDDRRIDVVGSIPVRFADYRIPAPGVPGISVEDHGSIEFLVSLSPAWPARRRRPEAAG